ncbi:MULTISPECIES: glycosyltransferase family 2 protein [unclassified Carboxylicivirga]|uniref:glycosyltransferase family 2 protein n=1 Tax=Carboxylicivirga TaxID=1628153 RepID=UPI003D33F80D
MLSICIPVYNVDVRALAAALNKQFEQSGITGEVIVLDDGSADNIRTVNRPLKQLPYVRYYEQENKGRAATRNRLGHYARYQKILFIDGDCMVSNGFVQSYAQPNVIKLPLVIGRLAYGERPQKRSLRLRWNYGRKREARIKYDRHSVSFLSSNFMIDAELFRRIQFDERIKGYGNEDTLFGIQLRLRQIVFQQIDNKVIHLGLEPAPVFLAKTRESLNNLWNIYCFTNSKALEKHKAIKLLKASMPAPVIHSMAALFIIFNKALAYFLEAIYPSILLFDLYKLLYLFRLKTQIVNKKQ